MVKNLLDIVITIIYAIQIYSQYVKDWPWPLSNLAHALCAVSYFILILYYLQNMLIFVLEKHIKLI